MEANDSDGVSHRPNTVFCLKDRLDVSAQGCRFELVIRSVDWARLAISAWRCYRCAGPISGTLFKGALFSSNENVNKYRSLPQKPTLGNPDGLPVGFVKDTYKGKDYVGFTCAACHTSQVNYQGIGIRVDGGPAAADINSFLQDLAAALEAARTNAGERRAEFVKKVLDYGHYPSEQIVIEDLQKYSQRLLLYNFINGSLAEYGYSRLDVLGRGYNRVQGYIITEEEIKERLNSAAEDLVEAGEVTQADMESVWKSSDAGVLSSNDRDELFLRLFQVIPREAMLKMRLLIFTSPDAPVSYPSLWESSPMQWNALDPVSGRASIGRNACELIGTFNALGWAEVQKETPEFPVLGSKDRYDSSIRVRNLGLIEREMKALLPPKWPEDILPPIERGRWLRGKGLFAKLCGNCHQAVDPSDPGRRPLERFFEPREIGTDPQAANNTATLIGVSGILENQYVPTRDGNLIIGPTARLAALLTRATLNVVATPGKGNILSGGSDWLLDQAAEYVNKKIPRPSGNEAHGSNPESALFDSLGLYKARSLNGIWATAPYLHNGSVPTLYDLLLPASRVKNDPADMTYRPQKFMVGSREFDAKRVGFRNDPAEYSGFLFDTTLPSNSNAGHEYGTRSLTDDQRWDLVEYLKSL